MWTRFMDMHSGGGLKEKWQYIYIEAPEKEAKVIFYNRFGHNPERVTCTCCGDDYSIDSDESFEQVTGYDRNCKYQDGKYIEEAETKYNSTKPLMTVEDYIKQEEVLVIRHDEISLNERVGSVPKQGYVWMD